MRGGIGEYPEIRRENEAGIKEVAARPDLNVMKRGKGVSITPGAWRRSFGGRRPGEAEKAEKYGGSICEMPTGQICSHAPERAGERRFPWRCGDVHGRFRGEIRQTTEGNGESGPHVSGEKRLRFVSPWHFCAFGSGRALLPGVQERKPGPYPGRQQRLS